MIGRTAEDRGITVLQNLASPSEFGVNKGIGTGGWTSLGVAGIALKSHCGLPFGLNRGERAAPCFFEQRCG
jgi:hypothetical protein